MTAREHALARARRPTIPEIVSASARRVPDRVALVFEGHSATFAELDARAGALAAALAERGVGEGDNVAMLMYNRIEFVEAFLGIQRLGACAVPVNFRLAADEVAYVLSDSRAVGLLVDGELAAGAPQVGGFRLVLGERGGDGEFEAALASAGGSGLPDSAGEAPLDLPGDDEPDLPGDDDPNLSADDERLAFLMYTSGTTGRPKGAMLSHRNLTANTMNWLYEVGAGREDVWLSGLPLFHIGGLNGVLPFLQLGATAVIEPSTGFDAARSLERLAEHAVTMCFFVPTQWGEICGLAAAAGADLSRLRVAMWGASPAPLALLEELRAALPGVLVVNAFGQTEMSSNTAFLKGEDAVGKMGSIGRPAINVETRIVDRDGADVAPGKVGEIVYRGPTVMQGYFGRPEETAAAFAGGWFHSGDLVREDAEGCMYVVDRLKDMLISGGENVYPAEVERTLARHPAVAEVAVLGIPHPRWVETPLAVVVAAPGATVSEAELIEHCRASLASYKKPGAVVFAAELPRNAAGKVLKRELRERHGDMFAGRG